MTTTITEIRGRFWRTIRLLGLVITVGLLGLMGLYMAFSPVPRSELITSTLVLMAFGIALTAVLAIASTLMAVRTDESMIRFRFCGITIRAVPRAAIVSFERLGRRGPVKINYGTQWYCPNGLIDHDELARLLADLGISQVDT